MADKGGVDYCVCSIEFSGYWCEKVNTSVTTGNGSTTRVPDTFLPNSSTFNPGNNTKTGTVLKNDK